MNFVRMANGTAVCIRLTQRTTSNRFYSLNWISIYFVLALMSIAMGIGCRCLHQRSNVFIFPLRIKTGLTLCIYKRFFFLFILFFCFGFHFRQQFRFSADFSKKRRQQQQQPQKQHWHIVRVCFPYYS